MLLRIPHLAEGQRVAIRQKHGIVSETLVAAWRPDKSAVHRGVEFFKVSVGPGEAERANELSVALATRVRAALAQLVFHRLHGTPEVLFGTRPARRVDTGRATERIDGEPGIIREWRQTRGRRRSARRG